MKSKLTLEKQKDVKELLAIPRKTIIQVNRNIKKLKLLS